VVAGNVARRSIASTNVGSARTEWRVEAIAEANGPVALGIHAGLGLLLVVGSISLVVRSVLSRNRALIVLSAVFLLAVLGAASSGASFVDSGHDSESASMAMLTGVALICALISLYVAGRGSREVTTR
jgi:formate hydrogenlyase subunit 4